MIKTEMLRVFVEVARAGNLVAAADALGRAPSAVSMTLKQLEAHLGQPLFESERKSRLTALGSFTLEMASRELAHFDRTVAALNDFARARTGEVRLAAVPSFAMSVLPQLVSEFNAASATIRLDIHDMDSASILRELDRERIDLGIVSDAREGPELRRLRLASDPFGVVMRADHILAQGRRLAWRDLRGAELIANPLCEHIDASELQAALSRAPLRVHNTTTLLAMVRAGLGVTVLPKLVCRQADAEIVFREFADPVAPRHIDLISRARDTPSPATAAFADFVASRLAGEDRHSITGI
jgi:DNA-binding transcriptional LysR family regulator